MVLVATQVKRRRGTTAENDAFTGAEGEIVVDTERHELRVHDGVTQGGFKIGGGSGALVVGQMLEVVGTADYTPEGCLLTDGAEYTKAQFPDLWENFLTGTPKLQTCTYTEYANQIAEYGFCNKFAVDTTNETFKVPTRNKYRKLVKKIVNGTSWANIYDDGWCEQGGEIITSTPATISLIVQMADAHYFITASFVSGIDGAVWFKNRTTTNFQAQGHNVNGLATWEVNGYAPIPDSTANITREFVVVANGTLNQEQMDWSAWASSLAGRATTDMSNLTTAGKSLLSGLGLLSSRYDDVAEPANNGSITYTAPENGYFYYGRRKLSSDSESCLYIVNQSKSFELQASIYWQSHFATVLMPVRKGDVLIVGRVNLTGAFGSCRFYYAEGVA